MSAEVVAEAPVETEEVVEEQIPTRGGDRTESASEPVGLEVQDLIDFMPRAEETLQKVVNVTEEYRLALERAASTFDVATTLLKEYLDKLDKSRVVVPLEQHAESVKVLPVVASASLPVQQPQLVSYPRQTSISRPKRKVSRKKKSSQRKGAKKLVRIAPRGLKFQDYLVKACGMLKKIGDV